MENSLLTADGLAARLQNDDVLLIDLMPPEFFTEKHIPGAVNACIYEMTFLEQVETLCPDRCRPIILCACRRDSRAAQIARDRLAANGWQVEIFSPGLDGWEQAGLPLAAGQPVEIPSLQDRVYRLDPEQSRLRWTGRNLNGRHTGTIPLISGQVTVRNQQVTGGEFVLDMMSIANDDLVDPGWRQMLLRHLLSDDFFASERYPQAVLRIEQTALISDASPGQENVRIDASLTLKGVTRFLTFPALIAPVAAGIAGQAHFDIDRTLWGVEYGSGRFFEKLGMHLVNDLVSIELQLLAL